MKLQTQIPLSQADNQADYSSQILLLGSCFSENIAMKLEYFKFQSNRNPFGILFHPKAIENLIGRAVNSLRYTETDVFFLNEVWQCYDAHSDLSDTSKERLLERLNNGLEATRLQIATATHFIITLGTAYVYRHLASNKIVANCHKVPQSEFSKELLSVRAIEKSLLETIEHVHMIKKDVQFIFTVSPVRHLKDGFIENQRSKAHLISAIHNVLEQDVSTRPKEYFPSYELMMDELRDYRFYEADMLHPNQLAINYIWEKFKEVWIFDAIHQIMNDVETIQKGLKHRPFHPESVQHQKFRKSLDKKIADLRKEYPFMKFATNNKVGK